MARVTIPTVAAGCLLAGTLMSANSAATHFRHQGNEQEYNLRLDQALSSYRQAVAADPEAPASHRAVAGTYLMRIAFRRGVVTGDDFLAADVKADSINVPKPPADLALGFRQSAEQALRLAEEQVQAHPESADAHFQLGSTIGLLASYSATVEGQVFAAFKYARRAYKANARALELDPQRKDAGLIVGAYQYIISNRSLPVRFLARMGGLGADKQTGIALIEAAARYPGENQTDAQMLLAMIYNKEQRYDEALKLLVDLQARYPDNRLLWLEAGATALRAGAFAEAKRHLDAGLAKLATAPPPHVFGEEALWHYKRGAALVGLKRDAEAATELKAALAAEGRHWVHARVHTELGKLADATGNRNGASQEYRLAVNLAKTANDAIGLSEAEDLLNTPYRR